MTPYTKKLWFELLSSWELCVFSNEYNFKTATEVIGNYKNSGKEFSTLDLVADKVSALKIHITDNTYGLSFNNSIDSWVPVRTKEIDLSKF